MSSKRLFQSCPNAKFKCVAKLNNFELAFMGYKEEWLGAVGNLIAKEGAQTWGVVWELNNEEMKGLEGTESKPGDEFEHLKQSCQVMSKDGENLTCVRFQFQKSAVNCEVGPPSPQYLQVIIDGAVEHKIDKKYIDSLRCIKTNGNTIITEAKFKGVAKLQDYQFSFMGYKEEWRGAVANAVPTKGEFVWGVVWEIQNNDMAKLGGTESKPGDPCEHVTEAGDVVIGERERLKCIFFRRDPATCDIGHPSPQYLQLITEGAIEHKLDEEYIGILRQTQMNGNSVLTEGMQKALRD